MIMTIPALPDRTGINSTNGSSNIPPFVTTRVGTFLVGSSSIFRCSPLKRAIFFSSKVTWFDFKNIRTALTNGEWRSLYNFNMMTERLLSFQKKTTQTVCGNLMKIDSFVITCVLRDIPSNDSIVNTYFMILMSLFRSSCPPLISRVSYVAVRVLLVG